jgi:hypothetical protein
MSKNFDFLNEDNIERIREEKLSQGIGNLKSNLANLNLKVVKEEKPVEKPVYTPRYNQDQLAEISRRIYRDKINPIVEEEKEDKNRIEVPDTIASRAHTRALSRALVGLRNGGSDGRLAPLAGPNGGNTGTGACNNYVALTTSMTLEEYEEYVNKKFIKEEEVEETIPEIDLKPEFLQENEAVLELENALLAMEDLSWQSIDKVMREICARESITPKQLHKDFKVKHGMIPDAWAKENQMTESVGWFPLDEMVRLNQMGQVYEVTFMFRGGRQRLKFFWPEAGRPSNEDMQKACQKFWPGARLLAFYPSMDPGDNQYNQMVMVPAMTEKYEVVPDDLWDFMSEEDTEIYDEIATEVGEPVSPVFLSEDGDYEMTISDHDTGEERLVVFGEGKRGLWDNIHAKRKRGEKPAKPGDKDYPKTLNVEDKNPCWKGYKRKPGTKKFADGSCIKEDSRRTSNKQHTQRVKANIRDFGDNYTPPNNWDPDANRGKGEVVTPKQMEKKRRKAFRQEELEYVPEDMSGMSQKSGDKRSTESGAGMTAKGVAKYNSRTGGNLKTAVTTPPSKLKAGSKAANRRKSFCARSRGWNGERGKAARRRWNC